MKTYFYHKFSQELIEWTSDKMAMCVLFYFQALAFCHINKMYGESFSKWKCH